MNKSIRTTVALILATLATLISGALTGALAGFLSQVIYVVILFPVLTGIAAGFLLEKVVRWGKIRRAALGLFLGGLMAVAFYGAYQYMNYFVFRSQLIMEMNSLVIEETGRAEPQVAIAMADFALKEESGTAGLPGYLLYKAKRGVRVGKAFGGGLNLGPFFTWVFWLLELMLIGWGTLSQGREAAGKPFCENCQRWYGPERHLGGVHAARADTLRDLLAHRDFPGAGALLETDAELPSLEVYAQSCGTCDTGEAHLALKSASLDRNGKVRFQPGPQMAVRPRELAGMLAAVRVEAGGGG